MARKLPPKDVVIIGLGWTGSILGYELAKAGLDVVAIERGPWRDTATDFPPAYVQDELRYAVRLDLFLRPDQETLTFRNNASETALPIRSFASFLPGNGVGGAGVHWNGQTWRFLPTDFNIRSHLEQRYGKDTLPADMTIQDWPISYDEIEPYYDRFEKLCGTSGKAGNLKGVKQPGGNPFEGWRCLAVALWVGFCLYLSLLDRSPRSYAFMLAGYTVALIGFPAVSDPGSIFETALARVEEISLGIICASLVSIIVLPRSVAPAVASRVNSWLQDVRRLSRDVLLGRGAGPAHRAQRLRLANDAVEIDNLAGHLAYDRLADANAARGLQTLRLHMLMLLPLLASITDRIAALGDRVRACSPQLPRLLDELSRWLATEPCERQPAEPLRTAIASLRPKLDAHSSWDQITAANLLMRLRELVDVSEDCRALNRAIAAGEDVSRLQLAFRREAGVAPARHRDHALALWSGAGAAVAVLITCAFWIATGWAGGASTPMMAAVGCSFFAAQDDPAPGIRSFAWWSLASIVVAAIYLFAIIPGISKVEVLIAALAPTFIFFGVLIARPQTAFIGMALGVNSATLLALQANYDADFASYANSAIAFLLGMAAAVVITRLARSVGAEWVARRLMKTNWAALALTAERRGQNDRARFFGVMLDRLGLLVQRFAVVPDVDRRDVDSLTQLRVGLNIIDLRRARHKLTPATLAAIDDTLDQLAVIARGHVSGPLPPELLAHIDFALAESLSEPDGEAREDALLGLIGIRRGLFPDAAAYRPQAPNPWSLAS